MNFRENSLETVSAINTGYVILREEGGGAERDGERERETERERELDHRCDSNYIKKFQRMSLY